MNYGQSMRIRLPALSQQHQHRVKALANYTTCKHRFHRHDRHPQPYQSSLINSSSYPLRNFSSLSLEAHLDLRSLNNSRYLDAMRKNIADRGLAQNVDVDAIASLYQQCNKIQYACEQKRKERNQVTSAIGKAKDAKERDSLISAAREVKDALSLLEEELDEKRNILMNEAVKLPNLTSPQTPVGPEGSGTILKYIGERPKFSFPYRDHLSIASMHDLLDFPTAATVTGSRFYYLKHELALLELALIQWSVHYCTERGYALMLPPDLIRHQFITATGFQPRDIKETQVYQIKDSSLSLIGTAEIPAVAYYVNNTFDDHNNNTATASTSSSLPVRHVLFSHCFRTEAGGLGQNNKGLYRVHQFSKVELVVIGNRDDSHSYFNELIEIQGSLIAALGLHARMIEIPSGDLGAPAYRKVDIECWMPSRNDYGEVSSASLCTDYQARRLNIRYRDPVTQQLHYVHTLNATACAIPRILLAILEQFQCQDGTVKIPNCLQPFMMGMTQIPSPLINRKR